MLICVYRVVLISGRFSYIVVISGHAIDIVAYFVGFEVSSRWPTDMCLSRGGFLHGGVSPTGWRLQAVPRAEKRERGGVPGNAPAICHR